MNKLLVGGGILAGLLALSFAVPALAAKSTSDITATNWRVYNGMPGTAKFWDINQPKITSSGISFPIQEFQSTSSGSFVIYLLNNYNVDMTDKTISATGLSWDPGPYKTRSTTCSGAHVRLEFQDVASGPYDSNDYWWSTGSNSLDMNVVSSGSLEMSLANRDLWTNQAGLSANDHITNWTDWTGAIVAMSPYDGFTKAVKNVKQVGLSFGSDCRYASGVARVGGAGDFTLSSFTITP